MAAACVEKRKGALCWLISISAINQYNTIDPSWYIFIFGGD